MDSQALPLGDDADDIVGDRPIETAEHDLRQRVLHNPGVRALVGARFITTLGVSTLAYGAMVYLATVGASQVTVSLMGATRFFAALLFGIGGGALVEVMSKRTAMVTAYLLMAATCFIVPTLWGTSISSLLVLVLVVAALGQIAIPAVKAATALVSTAAQVAVVAAIIAVAGGLGAAAGSAFLAPIQINVATMRAIIYVAGVALALGAVASLKMPAEATATSLTRAVRQVPWRATVPSLQRTAEWLLANHKIGAMILVGSIVTALFEAMNTLMPVYVRDVLHTNPTNTVYILAPGGIGFLAGTALGPRIMDLRGERVLGVMALMIISLGFVLFGLIEVVAPFLAPISPLRLLRVFGIALSPQIEAAGLISVLTAFGSTAALAAVQTYINRYVLLARQATTFGMQEVLDNALVLFAVIAFGMIATALGPRVVFVVAPPLVVAVVIWLVRLCFRVTDRDSPEARAVLRALLETTRTTAPYDPDDTAHRV
jgi:MFS family permease